MDHALCDDLPKCGEATLCVDTTRVFATGFSLGGMIIDAGAEIPGWRAKAHPGVHVQ